MIACSKKKVFLYFPFLFCIFYIFCFIIIDSFSMFNFLFSFYIFYIFYDFIFFYAEAMIEFAVVSNTPICS